MRLETWLIKVMAVFSDFVSYVVICSLERKEERLIAAYKAQQQRLHSAGQKGFKSLTAILTHEAALIEDLNKDIARINAVTNSLFNVQDDIIQLRKDAA